MRSFRIFVLGFLFVSFRPSSFRSHSCSTSACLMLSLSAFPLHFRFLSSTSLPVLTTQPLFLPFRSSRFRLTVASPVLRFRFRFPFFPPFPPPDFSCFVSGFRTWLSVLPFTCSHFASQRLPCVPRFPFQVSALSHGFRFRVWLFGRVMHPEN